VPTQCTCARFRCWKVRTFHGIPHLVYEISGCHLWSCWQRASQLFPPSVVEKTNCFEIRGREIWVVEYIQLFCTIFYFTLQSLIWLACNRIRLHFARYFMLPVWNRIRSRKSFCVLCLWGKSKAPCVVILPMHTGEVNIMR